VPDTTISADPVVLLRVDLPGSSDPGRFAESGLPVYAYLYTAQGSLPAAPG